MRYLIMLVYFLIYKDKTFLTGYIDKKKNTLSLYWGFYSMDETRFLRRERFIRNVYIKYRDKKQLTESLETKDETICVDGCPIKTTNPVVIEFDTYA